MAFHEKIRVDVSRDSADHNNTRDARGKDRAAGGQQDTGDEAAAGRPHAGRCWLGGYPVTQYWRKPKGDFTKDLEVKVNGRFTYWASDRPIPGGIAYENFELVEPFREGSLFIFGVTKQTPRELGFGR